ncbi:MAG TPA: hypothetical protein VF403_25960 [Kofleriaceae bacterium]
MNHVALALLIVAAACGKKSDAPATESSGSGSSKAASRVGGSGEGADTPPPGPGLTVKHTVDEFSGTYDKVFAKLANDAEGTTIAFVRGCPNVVCTDNVFEIEALAAKCPKAYLALATIQGQDPKPGHHRSDLTFAGPAEKSSTAVLEHVRLEISAIGPDGIAGEAIQKTTESSVAGTFKAEICGRM